MVRRDAPEGERVADERPEDGGDGDACGASTAQSSGASRPTNTSERGGGRWPSDERRAITFDSVVPPTLAPQPPHRIDACESTSSASAPAFAATAGGAAAPPPIPISAMFGSSSP